MKHLAILSALLGACAFSPPATDAFDQARATVRAAQNDPQVGQYAPAELDLAMRALREAEQSSDDHRAYLAQQRARIARELASARAHDAASENSKRVALEQRLRQAEEERDRALARAVAAELARDEQDRLAAEVRRLKAQVAELEAQQTERGWILTLGADLLFDAGQTKLKPAGRNAIANVARFTRERGERRIAIEGLSERRARAVRDALVSEGIDARRIEARGAGARGGRVEIVIGEDVGRAATGGQR